MSCSGGVLVSLVGSLAVHDHTFATAWKRMVPLCECSVNGASPLTPRKTLAAGALHTLDERPVASRRAPTTVMACLVTETVAVGAA
jgi:hypothetical protein